MVCGLALTEVRPLDAINSNQAYWERGSTFPFPRQTFCSAYNEDEVVVSSKITVHLVPSTQLDQNVCIMYRGACTQI